ncbi:MAG: hypothetical protein F7C07_01170 [Desulfurococcales archaeon]|nr:hypothetical protein [Desulfurococcales archaeon]
MRAPRGLQALVAEASSPTWLLTVILLTTIAGLLIYPEYSIVSGGAAGSTFIELPDGRDYLVKRVLGSTVNSYIFMVRDDLATALAVVAPLAASVSLAYSLESGVERFWLQYLHSRRSVLYFSRALSLFLWLLVATLVVLLLVPLSLSYGLGSTMARYGLVVMLVEAAALASIYSGLSLLAASVAPRTPVALALGIGGGFALAELAVKQYPLTLPLSQLGEIHAVRLYSYLATGALLTALGYLAYSRRDL